VTYREPAEKQKTFSPEGCGFYNARLYQEASGRRIGIFMPFYDDEIRDAVDRYFSAWNSLDPSAYVACFADDAIVHDPYGSTPYRGAQALQEFFGGIAKALQEVTLEAERIHIAGNRAAVVFKGKGTGKNGKPVHVEGIDVFEFNDTGRISALGSYWDSAAVLAKLRNQL
jgi:steroid Delta-isomerase